MTEEKQIVEEYLDMLDTDDPTEDVVMGEPPTQEPKLVFANEEFQATALPVLRWPYDVDALHRKSLPVETFDDDLKQLILNMFATMKTLGGVGIAAPQVGVLKRVIVIQLEDGKPMVCVNPEIVETVGNEMFEWEEGCLSVPGYFNTAKRPEAIIVKFYDDEENQHELELHGLYAFAFQHEYDHLEGKLFVDDLSMLKRMRAKEKVKKTLKAL